MPTRDIAMLVPADLDAWLAPFTDSAVVGRAWEGSDCPLARLLADVTGMLWAVYPGYIGSAMAVRLDRNDDPVRLPGWCGPILEAVDDLGTSCPLQQITAGALREIVARCQLFQDEREMLA